MEFLYTIFKDTQEFVCSMPMTAIRITYAILPIFKYPYLFFAPSKKFSDASSQSETQSTTNTATQTDTTPVIHTSFQCTPIDTVSTETQCISTEITHVSTSTQCEVNNINTSPVDSSLINMGTELNTSETLLA